MTSAPEGWEPSEEEELLVPLRSMLTPTETRGCAYRIHLALEKARREPPETECPHGYYGWVSCGICGNKIEKARREGEARGLRRGIAHGLWMYAWWRDGQQHVGTCGTTLATALEKVDAEAARLEASDG